MRNLQPEQRHQSKSTQPENSRSTTSTSFVQNAAMNMEQESMNMMNASSFQSSVLKKEPADESRPTTGLKFLEEWREVETGHYEIILDFEPAPKPKVVLPPITNGAANTSAVWRLQDRLEKAEAEVKRMRIDTKQHENALQLRPDAQMQENLITEVDIKLTELRGALQKQFLRDLSADQVAHLLEHPVISAKFDQKTSAARAEERSKLEFQFRERVDEAKKQLSEIEIREILKSNWFAQSLMTSNLHRRLEEEKTKLEAQIQERIEAAKTQLTEDEIRGILKSNKTAQFIFRGNLDKRLETERINLETQIQEKVEAAKTQLSENEIREILKSNSTAISIFNGNLKQRLEEEKSRIMANLIAEPEEKLRTTKVTANTKRPGSVTSRAEKPTVSPALTGFGFPSSPNEQISFGAGISHLTSTFSYPVTPLTTSPSSTPSVIFGETWKPRTRLGFLSSSPPVENRHSDYKAKIKTGIPSFGKRTRDAEDVGESEAGRKKFCSESKE